MRASLASGVNLAISPCCGRITRLIARRRLRILQQMVAEFPAVAILGPRQVGKTTMALQVLDSHTNGVYLDLESPSDSAKLSDPAAYLETQLGNLVVIDEVQRKPDLFPVLRGLIDRQRRAGHRNGQFMLLGSATGALLAQSAESLAGRIAYMELEPLSLLEVESSHAQRLWLRGGFPESFLAKTAEVSLRWRQQFISTYLERDIPLLGPRIPAETLRRLWTMLAHEQGQQVNLSRLAGSLAVSGQTVARYVDLLVDLMLVRRLTPWIANAGKRLTRSPKIYVRDSGLVHALLGLLEFDDVLGHPVAGGSWEGWVIEGLLAAAPAHVQPHFYRTAAGAEIDLVLDLPKRQRWAIEIKRSTAPTVSKGFHIGAADVKATKRFVVHGGKDTFPLDDKVTAITVRELQAALAQL